MAFGHDTEVALGMAAELVNSVQPDHDELDDVAGLSAFVARWQMTGRHRRTREELNEVRALRTRLRQLWLLPPDELVDLINRLLREATALPQLVRHDDWGYHVHATEPDAPLADRFAVEIAMAFTDLVRSDDLDRLSRCAANNCDDVLVDLSKNRSRRFCSTTCANRTNVAAFRARARTRG